MQANSGSGGAKSGETLGPGRPALFIIRRLSVRSGRRADNNRKSGKGRRGRRG